LNVGAFQNSFHYDANGNLDQKVEGGKTWTYQWNAQNQLVGVLLDGAEVAHLAYDPLGRRIKKTAGVTTAYLYDGEDIIREAVTGSAATQTFQYAHGPGIDEPLGRIDAGSIASYYHADILGSIVATTNATGAIASRRQYDAWGNPDAGASEAGYAFTGREWDPEIGLYYYRARYYNPQLGRFISEDPIGMAGGLNAFAYTNNRPTIATDPSGLRIKVNVAYNFPPNLNDPTAPDHGAHTRDFWVRGKLSAVCSLREGKSPSYGFDATVDILMDIGVNPNSSLANACKAPASRYTSMKCCTPRTWSRPTRSWNCTRAKVLEVPTVARSANALVSSSTTGTRIG
jgi:RHS repeat-associated protein